MDAVIYVLALGLVRFLQALPLTLVARIGRAAGFLVYLADWRHRRVAAANLRAAFPERSPAAIRALTRENFCRVGENFVCAIKTSAMTWEELRPRCEFIGEEKFFAGTSREMPQSCVVAIGHFGNFELYARFGQFVPAFQCATTYRGLRPPALDRILLQLRQRSGCQFFERRSEGHAIKSFMNDTGRMLGLLSDQNAGRHGVPLPFFGRPCSTTTAPAVFALRYQCPLFTGFCYRVGLGRWRIEVGEQISIGTADHRRTSTEIMEDVNRAFETAVRRDPANWFWMHNRWKQRRKVV